MNLATLGTKMRCSFFQESISHTYGKIVTEFYRDVDEEIKQNPLILEFSSFHLWEIMSTPKSRVII